MMTKEKLKLIIVPTLPVMAGFIFLGTAFGLVMRAKGFPLWYPSMMSIIVYAGSLQFAAVPVLAAAFDPISAFLLGMMLSVRHIFYGIPMLSKYKNVGKIKPFLIFGLTDEAFSILTTVEVPEGVEPKHFYVGVTLLDYIYWNVGTLIGVVCGNFLGDKAEGLDFAITALFIVLFIEQLKHRAGIISGIVGLLATLIALIIVGSSKMVIVSMIAILVLLLAGRRAIENE